MPVRKGRKVKTTGETRMRELGRKKVVLWFDEREYSLVSSVAARKGKPLAKWCREVVYRTADEEHRERARVERREADGR